jgi:hypothetical protein
VSTFGALSANCALPVKGKFVSQYFGGGRNV